MNVTKLLDILSDELVPAFRSSEVGIARILNSGDSAVAAKAKKILDEQFEYANGIYKRKEEFHNPAKLEAEGIANDAVVASSAINLGAVPDTASTLGRAMDASSNIAPVVGANLFKDSMKKWNTVEDIISATVTKDVFTDGYTVDWTKARLGNALKRFSLSPKVGLGDFRESLEQIPTLNKQKADYVNKQFKKAYDTIFKGASKEDIDNFNNITRYFDDHQADYKITEFGFEHKGKVFPASQKVQDMVLAQKELFDNIYILKNKSVVVQKTNNGGKLLDDAVVVLPSKKGFGTLAENGKWSSKYKKAGYELFEKEGKYGESKGFVILSQEDQLNRLKDIPQDFELLPYRKGYSPTVYQQPWRVTRLKVGEDGKIITTPHAVAKSKYAADNAVKELSKEGDVYFAHRVVENEVDLSVDDNFLHYLDRLSSAESDQLKKQLIKAGIDEEQFKGIQSFSKFFSYKRDSSMMRKGQRLLDADSIAKGKPSEAAIMPSNQAIARHLNTSANYIAHSIHFDKLEKAFMDEFSAFIPKGGTWKSPIMLNKSAVNGRTARDAYYVQAQMMRMEGMTSYVDTVLDSWVTNTIDKFGKTDTGKLIDKALGNAAEHYGFNLPQIKLSKAASTSKGFTAQVKLGLFNLSQIPVQGSAFLNVLGYSGKHAVGAAGDVMSALAPELLKFGRTSKGSSLYKMIDESGFISGFDFVGLQHVANGKNTLLGSTALKKFASLHMLPYTIGEGGVRALAWFAENRRLMEAIRQGKSTFKVSDIGSPEYLRAVSAAAMEPALNMSRMNQPLIARGLLGMPFQFQQFAIQQATFMLGKGMTPTQRARVFGAWVGAFGFAGVPFYHDLIYSAEAGYATATDDPNALGFVQRGIQGIIEDGIELVTGEEASIEAKQFVDRLTKGGPLPAFSKDRYNIVSRTTLSTYLHDMFGQSSVDSLLFGPGYQTVKALISNNISNIGELYEYARTDESINTNVAMSMLSRGTKGFSGIHNMASAIETVLSGGDVRNEKMQYVTRDEDLAITIGRAIGFSSGEREALFEQRGATRTREKIIRDIIWNVGEKAAKLSVNRPNDAVEYLNEKILQLHRYNPNLLRPLYSAVSRSIIATKAPEGLRELQYGLNRYSTYNHRSELELINAGLVERAIKED